MVDEGVAGEPFDGPAPGAGTAEPIPRGEEVGVFLMQFVFEPAEGAFALDGAAEPAPGPVIADVLGEVGHVLVPDVGGQWPDGQQVQVVEVDRGVAVDAAVGGPEHDLAGLRIDEPPVLIAGLVRQCSGDLLQVKLAQVQHLVSSPGGGCRCGCGPAPPARPIG